MYSYTGEDSGKRAKGVKKSVLQNSITHDDYKKCLLNREVFSRDMPAYVATSTPSMERLYIKLPLHP